MTKVVVIGMGRMGRLIVKRLHNEGLDILGVLDASGAPVLGKDAGILAGIDPLGVKVVSSSNLEETLDAVKPDVVVDFTVAAACVRNLKVVAARRINIIIGTTGFSQKQLEEIEQEITESQIGAVMSPNMSVGVNIFWKLVGSAAKRLKGYDTEILETHHRLKKDAPSGTAIKTAEIIAERQGRNLKDVAVYGRHGTSIRKEDEIGIHAIRAGDIVGEHKVIFCTEGERVEITHKAHSREAFVEGVVRAIKFIGGKQGIYSMKEVLGI